MAEKNQFSEIPSGFTIEDWNKYIPMNSLARKEVHELPQFVQENGLSKKYVAALVGASGSTTHDFYCVLGYRPDKGDMDEHAWVYIHDRATGGLKGGILHHGQYEGRTTPLPEEMKKVFEMCGVTSSIQTERMPDPGFAAPLSADTSQKYLSGVHANFGIIYNKVIPTGANASSSGGSTNP